MWSKSTRLAALAGLLLCGTAWSQGTIVHVVPSQPIYYSPLPSSSDLDLNNDGIVDYTLTSDGNTINILPRNFNSVMSLPEPPPDIGALVVPLSQGTSISSSLDPAFVWYGANTDPAGATTIISCMNIGCLGLWQNVNGYAGLQLMLDSRTYYGWLHIVNYDIQAGQILEWAYETRPGVPISAAAKPVPVPLASPQIVRPGYLRLMWLSEVGTAYQVQSKTRLESFAWTNLGFVIPAISTNSIVDLPINGSAQFFRVVEAD